MTYHSSVEEPNTKRLLYIYLTVPEPGSPFRHIRASVLRQAQADVLRENGSTSWRDGSNARGWRWAEWEHDKASALWVSGLHLNGQMTVRDEGFGIMNEGRPYGNELEFEIHRLRRADAVKIAHTLTKMRGRLEKLRLKGMPSSDDFTEQAFLMANALKITTGIVQVEGMGYALDDTSNFREFPIHELKYRVDRLINKAHGKDK